MAIPTIVLAAFASVLALSSAAGLAYDLLHRNRHRRLWPNSAEQQRAIATLRYYREVHDSSD